MSRASMIEAAVLERLPEGLRFQVAVQDSGQYHIAYSDRDGEWVASIESRGLDFDEQELGVWLSNGLFSSELATPEGWLVMLGDLTTAIAVYWSGGGQTAPSLMGSGLRLPMGRATLVARPPLPWLRPPDLSDFARPREEGPE